MGFQVNSPVLNLEFECQPDNEEKECLLTIAEIADEIKAVNYWEELKIRPQLKRRFDIQKAADFLIDRDYEIWFSNVCRIEVETTAATSEAISWIDYISLFFWKSNSMHFEDSEYFQTRTDTKRIGDGCLADPSDEELLLGRPEPFKDNSLFSFKNNSFHIKEREKSQ